MRERLTAVCAYDLICPHTSALCPAMTCSLDLHSDGKSVQCTSC